MVRVRVVAAALVEEDGTYYADAELEVSEEDARSLEEQGIAERVDGPKGRRHRGPRRPGAEEKPEG